MEFKKDDVLICVDAGSNGYLTNGKEYLVIAPMYGTLVKVIDNYGDSNNFHVDRFKLKEKDVKEIKWVVGQEVWDIRFGKGVVVCVDFDGFFKIRVKFEKLFSTYTTEGLYDRNDKHRSLYFSEPVVSAELYPKFVPTLIGKRLVTTTGSIITVGGESEGIVYTDSGGKFRKDLHVFYELGEQIKFD